MSDAQDSLSLSDRIQLLVQSYTAQLETKLARTVALLEEARSERDRYREELRLLRESPGPSGAKTAQAGSPLSSGPRTVLRVDMRSRSTWIDEVTYCPQSRVLTIAVHRDDATYTHHNVTQSAFEAFVTAASPGRYYNTRLRDRKSSEPPVIREETEDR